MYYSTIRLAEYMLKDEIKHFLENDCPDDHIVYELIDLLFTSHTQFPQHKDSLEKHMSDFYDNVFEDKNINDVSKKLWNTQCIMQRILHINR